MICNLDFACHTCSVIFLALSCYDCVKIVFSSITAETECWLVAAWTHYGLVMEAGLQLWPGPQGRKDGGHEDEGHEDNGHEVDPPSPGLPLV